MTVVKKECEKTVMIQLEFTREIFERLCAIWPNPETGKPGMSQSAIARATGISQGAISNYLKEGDEFRYPKSSELRKLGRFFTIITFVEDWSGSINNESSLQQIEAFLNTYAYQKAS